MRTLVDAHMIGSHETGNETYVANLVPALARLPGLSCAASIRPDTQLPATWREIGERITCLPLRPVHDVLRLTYTLPRLVRDWDADLLHVTYIGPFSAQRPLVVSVHDVSFRHYPSFFSARDRLLFATLLPATLRRASIVLTLSAHAQDEIVRAYPYLEGKVRYVYLAPDTHFRPLQDPAPLTAIKERFGTGERFALAVGNLQPRKNLSRLVEAFATVRRQHAGVRLVIAGKAQWQASNVRAAVARHGLEEDVVFTGYVSPTDLLLLYNAATVFVYPSLYEGFGLPILEAMACGTAVVTSNRSSIPEVAGDAAIQVNPEESEELAQAIGAVFDDCALRHDLMEKGRARVSQFSWHKTAMETARIYASVVAS